ncbi:AsmA family protein [Methyloradius palustris]|uniref:Cell envelope biogenesis protein AsmA n=1 Tax=Methyloradius palustris TaxID=2778876 RepID=A0A8D5GD92_9PROT|nr:AsmA family protein [Methyloradius palustris]BCM26161.1 cell envelope biogenesis protein AsmA [Methyloradius palustris]
MNKAFKYTLFTLTGLLLLVILFAGYIAATFNPNDYKPLIIKLVQDKKQRTLHLDGDIKLAFWPKIGANLGKLSISEHNSEAIFASVEGVKVSLALLPLLKKELVVDTIYVDGAQANIIRYKDGTTNFDDLMSKDEEDSQQIKFDIDGVKISKSALAFDDQQADAKYSISNLNLTTGHVALATPFDMATDFTLEASKPKLKVDAELKGNFMADPDNKHFVAKGLAAKLAGDLATLTKAEITLAGDIDAKAENMELLVEGLKLAAKGNLDGASVNAELAMPSLKVENNTVSGKSAQVSLSQEKGSDTLKATLLLADVTGSPTAVQSSSISGDLSAKQGAREITGKFSSPFTGNIEKLIFDLPKLAGQVQLKDATFPNGGIQADFLLNAHADIKQEQITSSLKLNFDQTKVSGNVGMIHFVQPTYHFDVDIDKLDADKYITKSESKTPAVKPNPDAPVDLSALKHINANGELRIGWLKLANVKSTNVRIKLQADDGVAQLAPFSAQLYEGNMNGSLKVDARSTPVISVKQSMTGIAIGPLLTDAINNDMLSGKGTLNLDVTTQGATVGVLKKSLNGSASLNLADGAVKGIDIAGTIRGVKDKLSAFKSETKIAGDKTQKTDFSEMVASFNIKNGVAHNEDLSMKAPLFRITGNGDIDIANETLNYTAKPTIVNSLKGQGGKDLDDLNGLTVPVKLSGTFAKPEYKIDFASLATGVAQKKLLDKVGGSQGEALKNLVGGNKQDALKSLLGGNKKQDAAPANSATQVAPPPEQKPETAEDKAKKKLNKLLGF